MVERYHDTFQDLSGKEVNTTLAMQGQSFCANLKKLGALLMVGFLVGLTLTRNGISSSR